MEKILWVISDDEGFKQALHGSSQFQFLSRLQDLYDLINKNDHTYQEIEKYFSSNADQIHSIILRELKASDIEVDGTDYDRKGIVEGFDYDETDVLEISNLKVKLDSVDEISEGNAIVTVRCSAHFSVYGSYDDFDSGVWDSEDKEYVFVPHYDVYEEHDADFYCELKLCFQEENLDYSFSVESVTCDIKLDQDSRVERLVQDPGGKCKSRSNGWIGRILQTLKCTLVRNIIVRIFIVMVLSVFSFFPQSSIASLSSKAFLETWIAVLMRTVLK